MSPLRLLRDPVTLGKGKVWYSKMLTVGLPSFLLSEDTFFFLSLTFDRLSTRMRVNSTFRKSSTATIMSLKIATSSPWRLSRPSKEMRGPMETQSARKCGSGSTHQSLAINPLTRVVRAWEKQTSRRWRTAWLRLTASFCCCSLTMLQAEKEKCFCQHFDTSSFY